MILQVSPQSLDCVKLWAIRWQIQQADILRDFQRLGCVPAGLVQNEYNVDIRPCLLTNESQMMIHVIGIYRRC